MTNAPAKAIRCVFYDGAYDSTPKPIEAPWDDLAAWLTSHTMTTCTPEGVPCVNKTCASKFGPAWSPVDYGNEGELRRDNNLVQFVTLAVLDLDHVPDAELERIAAAIEGYAYIFHSTHCHAPPANGSYRLIMQLSHPVPSGAWRSVLPAIIALLGLNADPACKDLSRLYFLPSAPVGTDVMGEVGQGKPLDVPELLERAKAYYKPPTKPAKALEAAPAVSAAELPEDGTSELQALRRACVGQRLTYSRSNRPGDTERSEILGRVIYGHQLAGDGARDNTVNQAATLIAQAVPVDTACDAVIELMRASLSLMPLEPEGLDHWIDRARYSYERAIERRREWEAEIAERNATLSAKLRALAPPSSDGIPKLAPERFEANPDIWRDLLKKQITKGGAEIIISCGHNATVILAYSPECRGALRFNEVTKAIEIGPTDSGQESPFTGTPIAVLNVAVSDWLFNNYEIKLGSREAGERIARVARLNSYDPLADYLRSLKWDGTPRIDTWLETYAGAITEDELGNDVTGYVRKVAARWLISGAARGMYPGSKVDTCLILEGLQGVGKSTLFRILGGAYSSSSPVRLENKDGQMVGARFWVIELAELTHLTRTAVEQQKAYLSLQVDDLRAPYSPVLESFPRRCVFAGSTNADKYLTDPTGNRRYWPVTCKNQEIDAAALRRDRDQLWAEAVHRLHHASAPALDRQVKGPHEQGPGERWWFELEEQGEANKAAEARVVETPTASVVSDWWFGLDVSKRVPVRTYDVLTQALKMTPDRINRPLEMEVANVLRAMGFTRRTQRIGKLVGSVWTPTDELKNAKTTKTGSLLQAVDGLRKGDPR